ncbi:MAG: hypothetical protein EOO30_01885 [Comamonadaceae bacterium]|nr:MAG: hypothetical protein EOO30_01885 [Comamonadaceae bacterium]
MAPGAPGPRDRRALRQARRRQPGALRRVLPAPARRDAEAGRAPRVPVHAGAAPAHAGRRL